jgi:putative ABC transport system substrate-binding protein
MKAVTPLHLMRCCALFLFAMLSCMHLVGHAQSIELGDWLKPNADALKTWRLESKVENPLRGTITTFTTASSDIAKKHVLILYPRASSAYDVALNRLLDVFNEREIPIQFTVINFQNDPTLGLQAIDEMRKGNFDLVYTMGSESTDFVVAKFKGGKTPVVSVCSKDPVLLGQMKGYEKGSGTNFAFTSLNMQIDAQLSYLLELKPKLKNIGILVDAKNKSAVQTQSDPIAKAAKAIGISPINIVVQDPAMAAEELLQKVPMALEEMRKTDPTLSNSVFWITGSTAVFKEIAVINSVSANVPVISVVPEVAKEGSDSAVLSIGISFDSNAYLAAIYGIGILNGKSKPGDLPVGIVTPPDISINFRRAKSIGLKIPFSFFERAGYIYDYEGKPARYKGITQVLTK